MDKVCGPRPSDIASRKDSEISTANPPFLQADTTYLLTGTEGAQRSWSTPNFGSPESMNDNELRPRRASPDGAQNSHLKAFILSELMGYNPKTQRAEYMKTRNIAKRAAEPLRLDKAWKTYASAERHDAVNRVFESFQSRFVSYSLIG